MGYVGLVASLFGLRISITRQAPLSRQLFPVMLTVLFLFSAFRYEVGCDWNSYKLHWELASNITFAEIWHSREIMWSLTLYAVVTLGLPYETVNVLTSAVFFWGIYALGKRQPDKLGFLVMLVPVLILNMPMSGIRQGAAIGIMCVAFLAALDARPIRYAIFVVIAATMHSSAAIFILFTPLIASKVTPLRVLISSLLAAPSLVIIATGESAHIAMERYLNGETEAAGALFRLLLLATGGVYFWMIRKAWKRQYPADYAILRFAALCMTGLIVALPVSSVIADRIGYYFIPLQSVIFARAMAMSLGRSGAVLAVAPYVGLLTFFIVWTLDSKHFNDCYIPYQTWIFGTPTE